MPIYAYRCSACGHAKDVLQKLSDPVLSVCPACGAAAFAKQVTAAGFQLKGSGWYATDFKGGGAKPAEAEADAKADGKSDGKDSGKDTVKSGTLADGKPATPAESKPDAKAAPKADSKPAAAPAAPAAPAAGH